MASKFIILVGFLLAVCSVNALASDSSPLQDFCVANPNGPGAEMVNQDFSVDLTKPLAFQVGHLGEAYQEWVHHSIVSNETPRLFQNEFIEFLARAPWWAVPLVWLPVAFLLISFSINDGVSPYQVAPTVVSGVFLWTLLEYLIHRFISHMRAISYWGITFHFLFHGCHHNHPMDDHRLVFPPAPAAIVTLILWNVNKLVIAAPYSYTIFGGVMLGYIVYDCTHCYLHRRKPFKGVFNELKSHHMNHHFKILDKGFGVTTTFWDRLFGTLPLN